MCNQNFKFANIFSVVCLFILYKSFPGDSDGKESICNAGDLGSIPGSKRSPGEGNGNPPPVFLSGEFHGQRSLAGYSPWDSIELVSFNSLNTVFHKEEFLNFNEV